MDPQLVDPQRVRWEDSLPQGLRVQALCIGVSDYGGGVGKLDKLPNATADAKSIARCVNELGGRIGMFQLVENPVHKKDLTKAVKNFVSKIDVDRPPRIILVFYAGHGMQHGDAIYLLPTNANPKTPEQLKSQGMSHDELFRSLKGIDDEIRKRVGIGNVLYLVILDTCRESLEGSEVAADYSPEIHGPLLENRPEHWLLCTSTSRRAIAYDGEDGDQNSPFTQALVSVECGLFQPNVPLDQALKLICKRVGRQGDQQPCHMSAHNIPDSLCLHALRHEPDTTKEMPFDICLCYREGGPDSILAERLREKLECCDIHLRGSEKRHLRVFLKAGAAPPSAKVQVANAFFGSTVILLLVSRDTFADINTLQEDSPANNWLIQLLWKYEMSLELFDVAQHKVVPLLTGCKIENFGRTEYETFDASDKHEEFWQLQRIPPLLKVQSIVTNALDGLRCNAQFAKKLDDDMLDHDARIPSIIRGRTIKESVMAFSSIDTFTPWKFEGIEDDAIRKVCRELKDLVEIAHEKRERADDIFGERASGWSHQEGIEDDVKNENESSSTGVSVRRMPDPTHAGNHRADEILEAGASSRKRNVEVRAAGTGCAVMQPECGGSVAAGGDQDPTSLYDLQGTAAKKMCTSRLKFQQQSVSPQSSSDESHRCTPEGTPEIVTVYVKGDSRQISQFLEGFIVELHGYSNVQALQSKWRLCKLVLLAFVRDNIVDMCSGENSEGVKELFKMWQYFCEEKQGISFFDELNFELELKKPSALEGWNFVQKAEPRRFETCIFVLDRQVHEEILKSYSAKSRWKQRVQAKWDEPQDTAESFLDRAEFFFSDPLYWKILGRLSDTGSFVVFFRMDALTALLVREQCQLQRMLQIERYSLEKKAAAVDEEQTLSMSKAHSASPAAETNKSSTSEINFVVSSADWHVWLAEGTSPSQVQVSEIVSDLQQIAHLPPALLEKNEVPLSAAGTVEVVCVEAAEIKEMPVKVDTSWTCADLAKAVCDELVEQGLLKVHPTFIRGDREMKYMHLFESAKLDGAKMNSLNGRDVEVAVRKNAQGEAWVGDLVKVLKAMMDPAAANDTKSEESAEVRELRNKMIQLARDDNSEERKQEEDVSAGVMMVQRLKANGFLAAGDAMSPDTAFDTKSNATFISNATTASYMTAVLAEHASQRVVERNISIQEIKDAKRKGAMSLSIHLSGNEGMNQARDSIRCWARDLTKASIFEGLAAGEPQIRGSERDRRLEVALGRSEAKGRQIKEWLNENKYFEERNRRIIFSWVDRGQPELVVVEGRIVPDVVGVVTVFQRGVGGETMFSEFSDPYSEGYANWFGKQLLHSINKGDNAHDLREMLDDFTRKEITDATATWWIGPYKLSEWHIKTVLPRDKSKPSTLLTWAAKWSCPNIVTSLINDYNCSVAVTQKVDGKDIGVTVLHEAAYCGNLAVVDILLEAHADYNKESNWWKDKFPLDSARSGLKEEFQNVSKNGQNDPGKVEQFQSIIAKLMSLNAKATS